MIRIILLGRTGNNLFQYALGRALAGRHGVALVLDGSWFNPHGWSEVSHFLKLPVQARVVRRCSLAARILRKATGKHYWEFSGRPMLREAAASHAFDPRLLDAPSDCVLMGYFQSPLYFEAIASDLRSEIQALILHAVPASNPVRDSLSDVNSVAVHVRRGDFLTHPAFQVCGLAYYRDAMDEMRRRLRSPRFHVFSDDPQWCRMNFKGPDTQVIDSGPASLNPLHDLHLMSQASHHIIANSSYSWWAAWLGRKEGQNVLVPPRWFAGGVSAPISEKLCPGWSAMAESPPCGAG